MAKVKKDKRPPSRKRYEEQHPTSSFRLDKEMDRQFREHLKATGRSCADFVKDAMGREKSMIAKKIEELASRQTTSSSVEERVRCLEDLVHHIVSGSVGTDWYPPCCPRCDNQRLRECEAREMQSKLAHPWVITWRCPKCGFLMNTYKQVDPKSVRWAYPESLERTEKVRTPLRKQPNTTK